VKIGRTVNKQAGYMSPILFNEENLAEAEIFKIGGRIIYKVRFAEDRAI
jgi:hypothetical protein